MKKRKSRYCVRWCDTKGCFDSYEERKCGGITKMVWDVHCKELDKLTGRVLNNKGRNKEKKV